MLNQFIRTELLIGKEKLEKLKSSHIAVFGVGGVGTYCIEALARSGVGEFDLIDNDKFSITNLNRQLYALYSTIDKYKVDVAKERILDINKKAVVNVHKTFFTPENSSKFDFKKYDYIVDAIDSVQGKIELAMIAQKYSIQIISSMGAGNKMNPVGFMVDDIYKTSVCPLAKVMRQELKKRNIKKLKVVYSKEPPIKSQAIYQENDSKKKSIPMSNAFVPSVVGLIIASEVVKDIIDYHQ